MLAPYPALAEWLHWMDAVPHLRPLLIAAYVLYLLWLIGWIMLQKREPVATLSWILSLAALPYLSGTAIRSPRVHSTS